MPRARFLLIGLLALALVPSGAGAQTSSVIPGAHRELNGEAQKLTTQGKKLLGEGQVAEALASFGAAYAADSLSSQAAENLGVAYVTTNLPGQAYRMFGRATALDPASASAWNRAGQVLLSSLGRPSGAKAAFEQALAIDPQYGPALFSMSVYRLYRGELDQADELIKRARSSPGDEQQSRFYYGAALQMLLAHGQFQEAEQGLRSQISEFPSDLRSSQSLALVYRVLGRPKEALSQLDDLMRIVRPQAVVYNERGMIFEALGLRDSAIVAFSTAWMLDSTSAEAAFHLSRAHLAIADTLRGLTWLSRAEARDPGFYATALAAARIYASQGQKEMAERALAHAKRLHPAMTTTPDGLALADTALAAAERDLIRGDLAVSVYRSYAAAALPARRGKALLLAAWASHAPAGSPANAITQLEGALEALPSSDKQSRAEAERELGKAHERIGNMADARQHLERALDLVSPKDPLSAPAAAALLRLYLGTGDRAAATRLAKKIGSTDDSDLLAALGQVADSTGDGKNAAAYRDRAKALAFLP